MIFPLVASSPRIRSKECRPDECRFTEMVSLMLWPRAEPKLITHVGWCGWKELFFYYYLIPEKSTGDLKQKPWISVFYILISSERWTVHVYDFRSPSSFNIANLKAIITLPFSISTSLAKNPSRPPPRRNNGLRTLTSFRPVSYTHLTLPTTILV